MKMVAMMGMIGLGFDANDKNFFELVEMARDVVLGGFLLVTHQSRGSLALQPAVGSSEYKCGSTSYTFPCNGCCRLGTGGLSISLCKIRYTTGLTRVSSRVPTWSGG